MIILFLFICYLLLILFLTPKDTDWWADKGKELIPQVPIYLLIWGSTVGLHTLGIILPGMYIASPMIAFRFKQANNLSI